MFAEEHPDHHNGSCWSFPRRPSGFGGREDRRSIGRSRNQPQALWKGDSRRPIRRCECRSSLFSESVAGSTAALQQPTASTLTVPPFVPANLSGKTVTVPLNVPCCA